MSEFNYFALVLSLCCSTGVGVGVFGQSESTLYMVHFIYGNGNIGESIVEDYWRKFEWFVTRKESIIWSIFTVKVIDHRFRFLLSL